MAQFTDTLLVTTLQAELLKDTHFNTKEQDF